ncbi:hypothetical protein HY948_00975 [Candidatus Gottesmanbacteria bacterium]|nr:hypothetical protein [Candidatus Gottesmanbacteria bacterium]
MIKTQFFSLAAAAVLGLSIVPQVAAENMRTDVRKEIKEDLREKAGSRPGILREFLKRGRAAIGSGKLTAKNGTTLTVEKDGKSYVVVTDSNTQFRRRFWGKATLDEMQLGDILNVIGLWADDAKTTINAKLVRDASIEKRFGVFVGVVKSLTTSGWVMSTVNEKRPDETVVVSSLTKFVNRKEEAIGQTDIVVGHRVRVKGLWDRANNTVTEVTHVKDFNSPVKPSPTPKT